MSACDASDHPLHRLAALGLQLPNVVPPAGRFQAWRQEGSLIYLSGRGAPVRPSGQPVPRVGEGVSLAQAQQHAREVTLYLMAVLQDALGDLGRVRQVVKLLGFVNAVPDFTQHTEVMDASSDLWLSVWGPVRGAHARSAVGVASLPKGFAVEIEAVVAVD